MEKLDKNQLKSALAHARFQKNRYWNYQNQKESELFILLNQLSNLNEDELTKVQLLDLIGSCLEYMKAHSLYVYYREDYQRLHFKVSEADLNGTINHENSED